MSSETRLVPRISDKLLRTCTGLPAGGRPAHFKCKFKANSCRLSCRYKLQAVIIVYRTSLSHCKLTTYRQA